MKTVKNKLRTLGLSDTAIEVYAVLVSHGAMSVSELAHRLGVLPQSLYRLTTTLARHGFIAEISDGYPKQYQARPLASALEHYLAYQRQLIANIMPERVFDHGVTSDMRILVGRVEIIDMHMALIAQATQDLMTISIGKKLPERVYQTTRDAVIRGLQSYLIFQQHTPENDMRLRRWKAQGSQVRVLPGQGYHLHIVDGSHAILSSTNVDNTKERTAVLISAPSVVAELRKYFFQQWQEAQPLH